MSRLKLVLLYISIIFCTVYITCSYWWQKQEFRDRTIQLENELQEAKGTIKEINSMLAASRAIDSLLYIKLEEPCVNPEDIESFDVCWNYDDKKVQSKVSWITGKKKLSMSGGQYDTIVIDFHRADRHLITIKQPVWKEETFNLIGTWEENNIISLDTALIKLDSLSWDSKTIWGDF